MSWPVPLVGSETRRKVGFVNIPFGPKARQSSGIKRRITLAAAEKDCLGSCSCSSHCLIAQHLWAWCRSGRSSALVRTQGQFIQKAVGSCCIFCIKTSFEYEAAGAIAGLGSQPGSRAASAITKVSAPFCVSLPSISVHIFWWKKPFGIIEFDKDILSWCFFVADACLCVNCSSFTVKSCARVSVLHQLRSQVSVSLDFFKVLHMCFQYLWVFHFEDWTKGKARVNQGNLKWGPWTIFAILWLGSWIYYDLLTIFISKKIPTLPGIPKPPNERNSFINCCWESAICSRMFQGYIGVLFDYRILSSSFYSFSVLLLTVTRLGLLWPDPRCKESMAWLIIGLCLAENGCLQR